MTEKEPLLLPEPLELRIKKTFTIASDKDLIDYLLYPEGDLPENFFSPHLELPFLEPVLKKMRRKPPGVLLFPEEEIKKIPDEELRVRLKNFIVPAEGSGFIFYDPATQAIKVTRITYGKYTEVEFQDSLLQLIERKNCPLVEIHTHPKDSLFSPTDFGLLILDFAQDSQPPRRLLKAALLSNPHCQLLALATTNTPLLKPDVFNSLIGEWEEFRAEEERVLASLQKRRDLVLRIALGLGGEMAEESLKSLQKIIQKRERGELLGDIAELLIYRAWVKYWERSRAPGTKEKRIFNLATNRFFTWRNLVYIRKSLAFAREIEVKLYISFNMRDFLAFSA